jgi:hypothetical protein
MLYIVCKVPKESGIEMMVRRDPFLPVEKQLKESKSRSPRVQILSGRVYSYSSLAWTRHKALVLPMRRKKKSLKCVSTNLFTRKSMSKKTFAFSYGVYLSFFRRRSCTFGKTYQRSWWYLFSKQEWPERGKERGGRGATQAKRRMDARSSLYYHD